MAGRGHDIFEYTSHKQLEGTDGYYLSDSIIFPRRKKQTLEKWAEWGPGLFLFH